MSAAKLRKKGLLAGNSRKETAKEILAREEKLQYALENQAKSRNEWEEIFDDEQMKNVRQRLINEEADKRALAEYDEISSDSEEENVLIKRKQMEAEEEDGRKHEKKVARKFGSSGVAYSSTTGAPNNTEQNEMGQLRRDGSAISNASSQKLETKQEDDNVHSSTHQDDGDGAGRPLSDRGKINKKVIKDSEKVDATTGGKKKLGIRGGNKEARKAKKERKKAEKRKKEAEQKQKGRGADDEPERYKKLVIQGESKPRSIDTRRLCTYHDFDAPVDLKATYHGKFREIVEDYDDL